MAVGTLIGWTHRPNTQPATLTVTMGCRRRSPGCGIPRWLEDLGGGCFAIREVARQQHLPGRAGLVARRADDGVLDWTGKVVLLADRLRVPYSWPQPTTVFVNDLSELFDDEVPDAYLAALWCVAWWTSTVSTARVRRPRSRTAPTHTYMILAKNHARLRSWIRGWRLPAVRTAWVREAQAQGWCDALDVANVERMDPVLPNIWVGVSVERQEEAELRIPALVETPAAVRYMSCEPLLGPLRADRVRLRDGRYLNALAGTVCNPEGGIYAAAAGTVDWVIAGGESKPGCRPPHPDWFRSLRAQTHHHRRSFFFKQWGDWVPPGQAGDITEPAATTSTATVWPDGTWRYGDVGTTADGSALLWKVGKKRAGHHLDGRAWEQFPG